MLQKDCTKRLQWPALLNHEFVKDRVIKIDEVKKSKKKRGKQRHVEEDSLGKLTDDISEPAQQVVSTEYKTKSIICKEIGVRANDSANNSVSYNYELPGSRNRIEDEEWIPFLQQTMKEIMNGEVDMLLTPHYISIFITPLKMKVIDHRVIQYIACLLSLPFVVSMNKDHDKIHCIYRDVKVITHLVNALYILMSKSSSELSEIDRKASNMDQAKRNIRLVSTLTAGELQTLEYTMLVLCRLVHWNHSSAIEFCHAIYATNGVAFLQQLLTLEERNARIVADLVAILVVITMYSHSTNCFVEEVVSFSYLSGKCLSA